MKKIGIFLIVLLVLALAVTPVLYELDKQEHEVSYSATYEFGSGEVFHTGLTDSRDPRCPQSIGYQMNLVTGTCKIENK